VKILIDTHAALWLFNEHENLSPRASDCLCDDENKLYISIASAWEIAIKHSLGKLTEFPGGVKLFLSAIYENPIELMPVLPKHVEKVEEIPYIHGDPFDRIIIATAMCENMAILTTDENIPKYDVKCVW
jgi:PIN domain nuclease of toxin-antitoxin system